MSPSVLPEQTPSEPAALNAKFHSGDIADVLKEIEAERFQLIISSPPYNINKPYERGGRRSLPNYLSWQRDIAATLVGLLSDNASLCWQTGNYVKDGEIVPLDGPFIEMFRDLGLRLRNRIIWRFNFGLNANRRFSGRYETLLWFTKTDNYTFNLDAVRVPQIYPGKRHSTKRGAEKAGLPSGNPLGKNPSDFWEFSAQRDMVENPVWDIPNVKANHPEKTDHICQFPIELAERCVLALTRPGDAVLDPFVGTGASVIAALKHGRNGVGIDKDDSFLRIAKERVLALQEGRLPMRQAGKAVRCPKETERVSQFPDEWLDTNVRRISVHGKR